MPLNIIRASAGSGKTYTLTRTFIEYCISDQFRRGDNTLKLKVKNILAITFTNKATAEMKNRILTELYSLAYNTQNSNYIAYFTSELKMDKEMVQSRCQQLLKEILSNYDHFKISTIDSFFTGLYRSIALDLLDEKARDIFLNTSYLISKASASLLDSLKIDDPLFDLLRWIMQDNIGESKGINPKGVIELLGQELFKDNYLSLGNQIAMVPGVTDFYENLIQKIHQIDTKIMAFQGEIAGLLEQVDMTPGEFSYGRSSFANAALTKESIIDLEKSKRFMNDSLDPDKWFTKKDTVGPQKVGPVQNELHRVLNKFVEFVERDVVRYRSFLAIKSNYSSFLILGSVDYYIRKYCEENNLIPLSEINVTLVRKLSAADAPIIFEKMGHRFKSIMIDEFQDTSNIQWQNLLPLVQNSLSEGYPNLVVGDIKQSIYRFRDGDWTLMHSEIPRLQEMYNNPEKKGTWEYGTTTNLDKNYRSYRNVVDLNNTFFEKSSRWISTQLENFARDIDLSPETGWKEIAEAPAEIYRDGHQNVPSDEVPGGKVQIEYLTFENKEDQQNQILEWLDHTLLELSEQGYGGSEIGILCRGKKEEKVIGEFLNEKGAGNSMYKFSSSSSLKIENSSVVQALVAALKIKSGIHRSVNIQTFYSHLFKLGGRAWDNEAAPEYFQPGAVREEEEITFILDTPLDQLYQFFETIANYIGINDYPDEHSYLIYFLEEVKAFEGKFGQDTLGFIEEWTINIKDKTIQSGEQPDAINLLTIHKSKGLEFDIVLMPFGNWDIEVPNATTILWLESDREEVLEKAGPMPIRYTSDLEGSYFQDEYFREYCMNVMDNLNMTYVAMTRAKKGLYILLSEKGTSGKKGKKSNKKPIKNTLSFFASSFPDIYSTSYSQGLLPEKEASLPGSHSQNEGSFLLDHFQHRDTELPLAFFGHYKRLTSESIMRGRLIHEILQYIKTAEDLEHGVHKAVIEGVVNEREAGFWKKEMSDFIHSREVAHFYDKRWKVYNEKTVMLPNGKEFRPDRVQEDEFNLLVIDYKTGLQNKKYVNQVRNYMEILSDMVSKKVRGYIIYIEDRQVEEVIL
ncbi:UvrD-helicase domain-containing protein [Membranihabitans maritimus]|uniref:UvrD-helicase domain-containing protein n=1 Tax=Membranihabitans maritimus TaxID=2904244 RepID=UPI001F02F4F2|nr:UvrD-helicase domain-containing protein [Membranihabitans maritimus]